MRFQLSVPYHHSLLSYLIHSEDNIAFHFELKSAPAAITGMPDQFMVNHPAPGEWTFPTPMDKDFEETVVETMRRTRL